MPSSVSRRSGEGDVAVEGERVVVVVVMTMSVGMIERHLQGMTPQDAKPDSTFADRAL
jgi:hypothetical protein